jgi:glycosyltransferase involved in cell wall biosynthesis
MPKPSFSVIIPAYNNAEYLPDSIGSVLGQTYPNFELIVVNDASPDNAVEVVKSFSDPRIKFLEHDVNKGLSAARNTGIRNAKGDYIALLDGDDYFHPDKLKTHAEFLEKHPDVGVTYNARFELNHSSKTIRDLWRPPASVGLKELLFGFPFGPSDMVVQREWAMRVNMFDDYYVYVGEDLDFNCRLALAGCQFRSVHRALNYRRYHSDRIIRNIDYFVDSTFRALKAAFSDSRCPAEIVALQEKAFASHYILWSAIAFSQNDTAQGQEYCRAAVKGNPDYLSGDPNPFLNTLISYSIIDENQDHEKLLRNMISQLPSEFSWLADQTDWAVGRGFLCRFVRAMIWGREDDARSHFDGAVAHKANVDRTFLEQLSAQIFDYQLEFGRQAAGAVLQSLSPYLEKLGNPADIRWLNGNYSINDAFYSYFVKDYGNVSRAVRNAFRNDATVIYNRGVIKIFLSSLVRR